jgi:hypothetical protein|tara:strand:+ start:791 stop:916 length:126 start_codon:yes stop_codon:yes gene_type:complete
MTRQEFIEWLRLCPTHKWGLIADEFGHVTMSFPIEEEEATQ